MRDAVAAQSTDDSNDSHPIRSRRVAALDILRLVAVVLVLGRHQWQSASEAPTSGFLAAWFRIGWIGVDLFFVLSGFLISGLLFLEYRSAGELKLARFFLRRGLKIYPAFWAMLFASVLGLVLAGKPVRGLAIASELLFVQNYTQGIWEHTWSLAVEEHFYLLLPLFLMILYQVTPGPDRFRHLPAAWLAIAGLSLALRAGAVFAGRETAQVIYPSHLRLDSLAFGVLLAHFVHHRPAMLYEVFQKRWAPAVLLAVAAICLVPVAALSLESPIVLTIGLTALYIASGSILLVGLYWAPFVRLSESRLGTVLAYLGAQSYSIYLWHMPVHSVVASGELSPRVELFVYLLGSVGFGVLMAAAIEQPILRMRDRWMPREMFSRASSANPSAVP